jgi:hypothetical protein
MSGASGFERKKVIDGRVMRKEGQGQRASQYKQIATYSFAGHPDGSDVLGCVSDKRQEDETNESRRQLLLRVRVKVPTAWGDAIE